MNAVCACIRALDHPLLRRDNYGDSGFVRCQMGCSFDVASWRRPSGDLFRQQQAVTVGGSEKIFRNYSRQELVAAIGPEALLCSASTHVEFSEDHFSLFEPLESRVPGLSWIRRVPFREAKTLSALLAASIRPLLSCWFT